MDGFITIGTKLDTKSFDAQIDAVEKHLEQLEKDYATGKMNGLKEDSRVMKELAVDIEKTKNKLVQLKKAKEKAEQTKGFDGLGKSIRNSVKDVGRLVLGIFGVRSAYMVLRRASSELATYDPQYAANLEYIRYVLTQAIAPVLRWIVQMAMQLLSIINSIVSTLFGVNIFAKGSADSFMKMKASARGTAKAAKEIKKQLAGFDELNVLSDQNDTSGGGGAGGVAPSMDLSKALGNKPAWFDTILPILAGIISSISAIKLGLGLIKSLGIGIMIGGIVETIISLLKYLKDPTWENFGGIIRGIGIALMGLAVIIGSVPLAVTGAIVAIVGTIIKYWDEIKAFLQKGIDWLVSKTDWVRNNFGIVGEAIYTYLVQNMQNILNWFDNTFKNLKNMFDGLIKFIKGVFTGDWRQAWEGIKQIFTSIFNTIVNTAVTIFNVIFGKAIEISSKTGETIGNVFKAVVNSVLRTIENVLNTPIRAINKLTDVINKVPRYKFG